MTSRGELDPAQEGRIVAMFDTCCPAVLPSEWLEKERYLNAARFHRRDGLRVIMEVAIYDDRLWLHVSFSYSMKLPTWQDSFSVKELFCGRHRMAMAILPKEAEYVNCHPYTLHLWCPLDHNPLPDFRKWDPKRREFLI